MVLAQKQAHRSMEQKRERPEINPWYDLLIFSKGGKNMQWERVSSTNVAGKMGQLHAKE